jgi:hypothetical protein
MLCSLEPVYNLDYLPFFCHSGLSGIFLQEGFPTRFTCGNDMFLSGYGIYKHELINLCS